MTRVGVITQARMTSSRLPGKVLLEAGGKSMLAHHVRRLQAAGLDVYVATTTNEIDSPIVQAANELGCQVFRGAEDDVLSRYAGAVREFELDVVVRVTSDCPLIDGRLVRGGVELFLELGDPDAFVSNTLDRTYPRGLDFEVMSGEKLLAADRSARKASQREHVTPWLYAEGGTHVHQITRHADASDLRITLDTEDDFALIRELFNSHDGASLDGEGLIDLLRGLPELAGVNSDVQQKPVEASVLDARPGS